MLAKMFLDLFRLFFCGAWRSDVAKSVFAFSLLMAVGLPPLRAQPMNESFLRQAKAYPAEGGYVWSSTGCPEALVRGTDTLLRKSKAGTYCSGFTFAVFFKVMNDRGSFDSLNMSDLKSIQQDWYGNTAPSAERQCVYVMEKWNLGSKIEMEHARPGDFIQFWRNNNTGHSALFLGWIRDGAGTITGLKYRSSQRPTNGIGERTEPIGSASRSLNPKRIYLGRIGAGFPAP
jgi:hypothetical protein